MRLGDKFKINFAQAFHGDFLAFVHAADFVVLAKYAVQVAAAEKHGAAAFFAADAGFFPKVQGGAGNNGLMPQWHEPKIPSACISAGRSTPQRCGQT